MSFVGRQRSSSTCQLSAPTAFLEFIWSITNLTSLVVMGGKVFPWKNWGGSPFFSPKTIPESFSSGELGAESDVRVVRIVVKFVVFFHLESPFAGRGLPDPSVDFAL